jgi:long-chain acyl-CoA synthetase
VAVLMENHLRFAEICWAAFRSGLYFTPVNVQLMAEEAAFVLTDSGATVVITTWRQAVLVGELQARCPGVATWLMTDQTADGCNSYEAAIASQAFGPLTAETEGSAMIYSSGTTGRPKGIKRPLSGQPPGSSLFGVAPSVAEAYGLTSHSVALIPAPLYHSSGLTRLMMSLGLGASVVVMEKFDPLGALAVIEARQVTHGLWVPTMFVRLLRLSDEEQQRYDLSSMLGATVGSGPCAPEVKEAMIRWWGPIITETYGGTEGNGMTRISSLEALDHPGSVGRPVFGEIHILDGDNNPVPKGHEGTVYFSGGRPFEYYNDPSKTAEAYVRDGWSTLGDIGRLDAQGYLYLTDRVADVIISGAVNIYPREVEQVLARHPAVDDVAVIGVPNAEFGEEVLAVVVAAPGAWRVGLADELIAFTRDRLAHFKCPRSVDFVEALPRQQTGKLFKRQLRARYQANAVIASATEEKGSQPR